MKKAKAVLRSATARLQQTRNRAAKVDAIISRYDGESLMAMTPEDIAALRREAEQILQGVHEFSAYWNVLNTN